MPRVFLKNIFQEIKHSLGRFFSILLIVAIGVAFFAGIKASAPDMKNSADSYFDEYNVQDIQVYSTLGLYQNDIDKIKEIEGVEDVQAIFTIDTLAHKDSSQIVIKVFSLPEVQTMNKVRLIDGKLPEHEDECLIMAPSATGRLYGGFKIGDIIDLTSGTDADLKDTLKNTSYKIVGTCYNPNYLSYQLGSSNIGSGSVGSFIYIQHANILADYYTEADVTIKGAKDVNMYSDEYFDIVKPVEKKIKNIAGEQIDLRIQELQDEINDAKREMKKKIQEAKDELEDGKAQLEQGKQEIYNNELLLQDAKKQLDDGWKQYNEGMDALGYLPQIEDGINQIDSGVIQIDDGIAQIEQGEAMLPDLISQRDEILNQLGSIEEAQDTLNTLTTQCDYLQRQINYLQEQIDSGTLNRLQLAAARITLLALQPTYNYMVTMKDQLVMGIDGLNQLNEAIAQIEEGIASKDGLIQQKEELLAQREDLVSKQEQLLAGKQELEDAYKTLTDSQQQYNQGLAQLNEAKALIAENEQKLLDGQATLEQEEKDALEKIEEGQKEIDELEGKWIVLDRNSHYSYRDYGACADRMDGIAKVFPVFFFLVAALVCMTTMTRMVDEQRNEIGTMKALGYSKLQIASKYIIYAFTASILGSALGCSVGMYIFPLVIFTAWNMLYNLPGIVFTFQPGLILLASGSVTGITLAATIGSIYNELIEVPSQLMRPKAAKAGKKILLERIGFIWNHLSFLQKVTARNLFRYKKRFYMTIVGIAGCSALLVAGFGINDSIGDIVNQQYGAIYHYNASIAVDKDSQALQDAILEMDGVEELFSEEQFSVTANVGGKDMSVATHVIDDLESLPDFLTMKSTKGNEELILDEKSVYISQKLAMGMDVKVGDTITVKDANEDEIKIKIDGIFENYVGHHIFVSREMYNTWDTVANTTTTYLLKNENTEDLFEKTLGNKIMSHKEVTSVTFYSSLAKNFKDMISSLSMIVVVLVISAGALAFVVLYNLSNVNISERVREIATIKVLGFLPHEVSAYVNRESTILTIIGAIVGLGVGIGLHHLIMNLAEMDDIMFGRTIKPISFVISFGLTILFSLLINLFMRRKLKQVQMVESLKAVE